jgi:ligand-binding SRPBCC domain-containing protein
MRIATHYPREMRQVHTLEREQRVALPIDQAFAFYGDARNLERITPPLLRFEVTTPKPIEMGVGTLIEYRLRLHGVPVRWRTRIEAWEPPKRFVDVQVKGPYSLVRRDLKQIFDYRRDAVGRELLLEDRDDVP